MATTFKFQQQRNFGFLIFLQILSYYLSANSSIFIYMIWIHHLFRVVLYFLSKKQIMILFFSLSLSFCFPFATSSSVYYLYGRYPTAFCLETEMAKIMSILIESMGIWDSSICRSCQTLNVMNVCTWFFIFIFGTNVLAIWYMCKSLIWIIIYMPQTCILRRSFTALKVPLVTKLKQFARQWTSTNPELVQICLDFRHKK